MEIERNDIMVSISCITYNQEKYIRQCLEGFVIQKTNFKFKAIVHDDASSDGTADVIREYANKYPDIIEPIFETENQYSKRDGSLARIMYNACSKGKYIAICEGDDYWIDPFKLQKQIDFLETHPEYSMCTHAAIEFYQDSSQPPVFFPMIFESRELTLKQIVKDWIIPSASIVFRKDVYPLPEWSDSLYSGDMTLALMAFSKGHIYYMNDIMSFYRKHNSGISNLGINPPEYVCEQKAKLFELFNKETNFVYAEILNDRVAFYLKNAKFWKLRKKGLIYAIIRMPLFALTKYLNR